MTLFSFLKAVPAFLTALSCLALLSCAGLSYGEDPEAMVNKLADGTLSLAEMNAHLSKSDLDPLEECHLHKHLTAHFKKHGLHFTGLPQNIQNNPDQKLELHEVLEAKPVPMKHKKGKAGTKQRRCDIDTFPQKAPLDKAPFIHSGKLVIRQGNQIVTCSAHLLSPELLLTAAHCFDSEYHASQIIWYQAFDRGMFLSEVKPVWVAHNENYEKAIDLGTAGIRHPTEEDRNNAIDAGFDYVLLGIPARSAMGSGNPLHCFKRGGSEWKPRMGYQIGYGAKYGSANELYMTPVTIVDVTFDSDPLAEKTGAWIVVYNGMDLGEGSSGGPFLFHAPDSTSKDGSVVSSSLTGVITTDDNSTYMIGPAFLSEGNFVHFLKAHKITASIGCE